MSRFVTPHTGPNRGRLCQERDGQLVPCAPVESSRTAPAVALPVEVYGRDLAFDRETVDLMTGQQVEAGHTPERAREIAVTAAMRNRHGQSGRPYTSRS